MAMRATEILPDDLATLKALIAHERATHMTALSARDEVIERLHAQMRLLLAQRFGAKSERVAEDSAQFGLFNEAETDAETALAEDPVTPVAGHTRAPVIAGPCLGTCRVRRWCMTWRKPTRSARTTARD